MSKVYVVGLGPGADRQMTLEARAALDKCKVIVGYTVYVDLIKQQYPEKTYLTTPMTQEVKRCQMALEEAAGGRDVAMVCSGDAGIYGMAGLIYETGAEYPDVEIEIVPGITAANGGAAVLGAPLMHDFAVISLSDLLTRWEVIETRLRAAAQADFVICLYNPASKKRADYLRRACAILLEAKSPQTVCATARNIGRDGQESKLMTLTELADAPADMFTTVFIGNSRTKVVNGRMVTPRGYEAKGTL